MSDVSKTLLRLLLIDFKEKLNCFVHFSFVKNASRWQTRYDQQHTLILGFMQDTIDWSWGFSTTKIA